MSSVSFDNLILAKFDVYKKDMYPSIGLWVYNGYIIIMISVRIISMQTSIAVGISLPKKIVEKIDKERQDVSRSKYVLRIIERLYLQDGKENKNCCYDSLDSSSLKPASSESFEVSK